MNGLEMCVSEETLQKENPKQTGQMLAVLFCPLVLKASLSFPCQQAPDESVLHHRLIWEGFVLQSTYIFGFDISDYLVKLNVFLTVCTQFWWCSHPSKLTFDCIITESSTKKIVLISDQNSLQSCIKKMYLLCNNILFWNCCCLSLCTTLQLPASDSHLKPTAATFDSANMHLSENI